MKDLTISRFCLIASVLISILVAIASLLGLTNSSVYSQETANWALQARGQDIGNLLAAPTLLFTTYYITKKLSKAFFVWLGTIMYLIYAYLVYSFATHFNQLFLVYVAILGLSIFSLINFLATNNLSNLSNLVPSTRKTRAASIFLIIVGGMFLIMWLGEIIPALSTGSAPASLEGTGLVTNPIHVIDLAVVLPGMILTGILYLRQSHWGKLFLTPWLTFVTLMGSSIVFTLTMMLFGGYPNSEIPLIINILIVSQSLTILIVALSESAIE